MCGRYTQTSGVEALHKRFRFEAPAFPFELIPRYNLAPSQRAPVVVSVAGRRRLELFQWGLVPSWAKDPRIGYRQINARAETAGEKPAFRAAFAKRRCLVLADGFYEWKAAGRLKLPLRVVLPKREPFAFAGLWEEWRGLRTFTLLTTDAPPSLQPIHDRVPVILPAEAEASWLAEDATAERLRPLLAPPAEGRLTAYPVAPLVNSPKADSPECLREWKAPEQPPLF